MSSDPDSGESQLIVTILALPRRVNQVNIVCLKSLRNIQHILERFSSKSIKITITVVFIGLRLLFKEIHSLII